MGEEVIIVAIVFSSIVTIVFLGIMSSFVHTWIKNRSRKPVTQDEEFLEALREFKTKTDRRLSALEIRAGFGKPEQVMSGKESDESIRIDSGDDSGQKNPAGGKLRNMLKE